MPNLSLEAMQELLESMFDRKLEPIQRTLNTHTALFDKHTGTLEKHTVILDKHTDTLEKHTAILDQNTDTLEKHTVILEKHTVILGKHTHILNEHTSILEKHTVMIGEHTVILNNHTALFKENDKQFVTINDRLDSIEKTQSVHTSILEEIVVTKKNREEEKIVHSHRIDRLENWARKAGRKINLKLEL